MDRAQKEKVVEDLGRVFSDSGAVVVCHYVGLTVAEMTDLRSQMRAAGAKVRIAKNRLAKIALEGKPCGGLSKFLTGQTLLAYAEDPVSAAKVVDGYAKKNEKLVILGGAMGEEIFDVAGVKSLASMPSREELLALIIGAVTSPAADLVSAISGPGEQISGIAQTLAEREAA